MNPKKRPQKSDTVLRVEVNRALKGDIHVNEKSISAEVKQSIVTLSGSAESHTGKMAAQQAVYRIGGVRAIVNNIQVHYRDMESDADIAQAVRDTLQWAVFVPAERIKSTVVGGMVTLHGEVVSWREREEAARGVSKIPGVRDVINMLRINAAGSSAQ